MNNELQALIFAGAAFLFSQESVSTSATSNSSAVDTLGKGDTMFLVNPSSITGAAAAVKVQDSADGSTDWQDVDNAALSTLPGASDDGKLFAIIVTKRGTAHRRYLRLVYTQSGTGASTVDALAIHSRADEFPASASDAGLEVLDVA